MEATRLISGTRLGASEVTGPRPSTGSGRASLVASTELRVHDDLRHEAGSRLVEAGWPLHHVQVMLGHANVKQTSTCLNPTAAGLAESMRLSGTLQVPANAPAAEPRPDCRAEAPSKQQPVVN
jgi:hypothetical protein